MMRWGYIDPTQLGVVVRATAELLVTTERQIAPQDALYAEKANAFQCRTCQYATPVNATHGHCRIMIGTVHLDEGCCAMWSPDDLQLKLYREPQG